MKEFEVEQSAIVNHKVLVVCENDDRHHFRDAMIKDATMSTALMRDTAKFFSMGHVKGRYIYNMYPLEVNVDKPGAFAKTAREAASNVIKMWQLANEETRLAIEESLPILKYIRLFEYNDVKETMVALQLMGHHEEMIFFLFMHLMTCEIWP